MSEDQLNPATVIQGGQQLLAENAELREDLRRAREALGAAYFITNYAEFRGWLERNAALIRSCVGALGEEGRS